MIKICHVTSAHKSDDARIFKRECGSLARVPDYDVYLLAKGESREEAGVTVIGVGEMPEGRWERYFGFTKTLLEKALEIDADIYHLHDPELLSVADKLRKKGKAVIYDSHEDYALYMMDRQWIPKSLRKTASNAYKKYEKSIVSKLSGAVVCYHWTKARYDKYNKNVEMIFNFPLIDEGEDFVPKGNTNTLAYAGGISQQWCQENIIAALEKVERDVTYILAGSGSEDYMNSLKSMAGWSKVEYLGRIPQEEVQEKVYERAYIGMAVLDYISQCKGTLGNLSNTKLFEYMYMGLPVICTDFVLWKEIINEEKCGICVCPKDVDQITDAIKTLLDNPEMGREMGERGRQAVINKYNWSSEEKKLLSLYKRVIEEM